MKRPKTANGDREAEQAGLQILLHVDSSEARTSRHVGRGGDGPLAPLEGRRSRRVHRTYGRADAEKWDVRTGGPRFPGTSGLRRVPRWCIAAPGGPPRAPAPHASAPLRPIRGGRVRGGTRAARATIHRLCSTSTSVGAWRSLVARIVRDDEVGGSNPLAPTIPSRTSAAAWNRAPAAAPSGVSSSSSARTRDTSLVPPVIGRTTGEPAVAMPRGSSSAPLICDLSPLCPALARVGNGVEATCTRPRSVSCTEDGEGRRRTAPATR